MLHLDFTGPEVLVTPRRITDRLSFLLGDVKYTTSTAWACNLHRIYSRNPITKRRTIKGKRDPSGVHFEVRGLGTYEVITFPKGRGNAFATELSIELTINGWLLTIHKTNMVRTWRVASARPLIVQEEALAQWELIESDSKHPRVIADGYPRSRIDRLMSVTF